MIEDRVVSVRRLWGHGGSGVLWNWNGWGEYWNIQEVDVFFGGCNNIIYICCINWVEVWGVLRELGSHQFNRYSLEWPACFLG